MLTDAIKQLIDQKPLTLAQSEGVMREILQGASDAQVAAILVLMRALGETPDEVAGFVKVLRENMNAISGLSDAVDIVGTGGDGYHTFNISTAAAMVVASCGVRVVKNGSRAVSSRSGSSDVLQALGCQIELDADQVRRCVDATHFAFCFAPMFHPSWVSVKAVREQLKVRTMFNLLGPLLNPAQVDSIVLGVCDEKTQQLIANALLTNGQTRAMVVTGSGLDEISTVGPVSVLELRENTLSHWTLDPKEFGFDYCSHEDLRGGDATHNANMMKAIFAGANNACADTVVLNAAAALVLHGHVNTMAEGVALARQQLTNGRAQSTLQHYISATQS